MNWVYGVTTVPERRAELLPKTLESLAVAGFDSPRLFVDGCDGGAMDKVIYGVFGLEVTYRWPKIRTFGNWALGMWELYIRNPWADRYTLFQDDILLCKNLRRYLESVELRPKTYWNLYTTPANRQCARLEAGGEMKGFFPSNQMGKGALALVFDRRGVVDLFSHRDFVNRPQHQENGWRNVDGAVIHSLVNYADPKSGCGYQELCHNPSLVQHIGLKTTTSADRPFLPVADNFLGSEFDASTLPLIIG